MESVEIALDWRAILVGLVTIAAIALAFWILLHFRSRLVYLREREHRWMFERDYIERERALRYELEVADKSKFTKKTLTEIIEEKKKKFQNITGVSFHFVDKDEVTNFYNDTFREPTIESLVTEMAGELTGEIKVGLPKVLESKLGGRDFSKWISTVKLPDTSLPGMFARYQREAIERGEVTLGLEELDIELNQVEEFRTAVGNLEKSFGLILLEDVVNSHIMRLKQQAAETMVAKLEAATGWVLIEGKFKIEKRENMYRCAYMHPVNEFVSNDRGKLSMSFTIPADKLEPRYTGNYAQSVEREIPMRVFAKVWQPISRKSNTMDLEVPPLAVYS